MNIKKNIEKVNVLVNSFDTLHQVNESRLPSTKSLIEEINYYKRTRIVQKMRGKQKIARKRIAL